ncbi:hypothetical protein [Kozakia baliensis]|uniref:Uncharacterized protein n=1 Tax=Kozakia baliensis TaxID=153496 RepID=A0A1D8UUL9_9PROT|nr:hypothetical protein [Kozakia baliensis]AOX17321.1 hypothetical protein A0U89_09445 [Kozakia baliensis]GBR30068.1 hypothetical protein AA0488_1883 [Kozakia baliensis NRIC 0488]GEL63244.1 hypothetical protein KBA01_05300 [Kozakia baliensis]
MTREATIAIFPDAKSAQSAVDDLLSRDISPEDVKQYAVRPDRSVKEAMTPDNQLKLRQHKGFWNWLTGGRETEKAYDEFHHRYDNAIKDGGVIVAIFADEAKRHDIDGVLSFHPPLHVEKRVD